METSVSAGPVIDIGSLKIAAETREWLLGLSSDEVSAIIDIGHAAISKFTSRVNISAPPTIVEQQSTSRELASAKLGQQGEEYVAEILSSRFLIASTAQQTARADITLNYLGYKVLVEVKNYTRNVPRTEIEKFYRDLLFSRADCGIFISLKTPISGLPNEFTVRYESIDNRLIPVVYYVGDMPAMIIKCVEIATSLAKSFKYLLTHTDVDVGVETIVEQMSELTRAKNMLRVDTSTVTGMLNERYFQIAAVETNIRQAIDNIKEKLCGGAVTSGGVDNILSQYQSAALTDDRKQHISAIMSRLQARTNDITAETPWKLLKTRIIHCESRIDISLLAKSATISFPLPLAPELMTEIFKNHLSSIRVETSRIYIEISGTTIDIIMKLMTAA